MSEQGEKGRLESEIARLRTRLGELEGKNGPEPAAFLRSLLEATPAFILYADRDLRVRFINRVRPDVKIDDVVGRSVLDFTFGDDVGVVRACLDRVLATGAVDHFVVEAQGTTGRQGVFETHVAPVREPAGGLCLLVFDITEHHRREEALAESEQKLRVALDATGIGLWSWDLTKGEVTWDERMRELCGVDGVTSLDEYVERIVHPDDRDLVAEAGRRTMASGRFVAHPHRVVRPDGSVRWMLSSGKMLRDAEGRATRLVGGQIDVTEQRALEDRVLHTQKIDAVGSLTTGIAHNFNNLLMVVGPSLDLLAEVVPSSHQQVLADAREAAARAAELVRQLMTFAGQRRTGLRSSQNVGELIDRVVRMCRRTFDRHIELRVRLEEDLPLIACDPAAIEQVLLNVLLNARDAVLASGRLAPTVHVSAAIVGDVPPTLERAAGRYLRITVSDDGVGMGPEVRARIFEPFFTTKSVAEGTGLGLATSYAMVREHDGWIDCESAPGKGTSVAVHLPVGGEVERRVIPRPPASSLPKASILIVDDEDAIRRVVGRMLGVVGYRVTTAESGAEALEVLGRDPAIDLILLDRSMPAAPGHTLVGALREASPGARVAYFTGQEVSKDEARSVDGVITKPVTIEQLTASIAAILGR